MTAEIHCTRLKKKNNYYTFWYERPYDTFQSALFLITCTVRFCRCLHMNTPPVRPSTTCPGRLLTTEGAPPPQNMLCLRKTLSLARKAK